MYTGILVHQLAQKQSELIQKEAGMVQKEEELKKKYLRKGMSYAKDW